jgi:hypothetical protein
MIVSEDQGLASIIREGDYFVMGSIPGGLTVEFSADGPREGPVIGAFAALRGRVLLWTAEEASKLLSELYKDDAEAFLLREVRRDRDKRAGTDTKESSEKREPLGQRLARLLRGYAQEFQSNEVLWEGWLSDFHSEVVNKVHPAPLGAHLRRVLLRLDELLPGIRITQEGEGFKGARIRVDWASVATGE